LTTWKEKVKKYGYNAGYPLRLQRRAFLGQQTGGQKAARVAWSQLPAAPVFAAAIRGSLEVTMLGVMGGQSLS